MFSHPDDESLACGGLLAWCADAGVRVVLVCATRGERGPRRVDGDGPCEPLREIRERELAAAARTLGISEVVLLNHADGFLPWIDAGPVEAELRDVIQRVRPDVVITFGADGLYWHPDHIATHQHTTAAVASLGEHAPALYYVTMPHGFMRSVAESVLPAQGGPVPALFGIPNLDAFGAGAEPPTLIVDASAYAARKLAALRCHRSQLLANGPVTLMSEQDAPRLLGIEHFHRARVGASGASFLDRFAVVEAS